MRCGRGEQPQDIDGSRGRADERREQRATLTDVVVVGVRANVAALHPLPPKHHADRLAPDFLAISRLNGMNNALCRIGNAVLRSRLRAHVPVWAERAAGSLSLIVRVTRRRLCGWMRACRSGKTPGVFVDIQ